MTTKNYKISLEKVYENENDTYSAFHYIYRKNLVDMVYVGPVKEGIMKAVESYDINNTSVVFSTSEANLKVDPNAHKREKYANLRMTGVENIINKTEKEIKSKRFELEEIK